MVHTRHPQKYALLIAGLSILWFAAFASTANAIGPNEALKDPALEARARAISAELRCLVCQNQSIDDSDAPLAKDLRILVRERLMKGETDHQVLDFVVARYGEFALLRPRFAPHTLLLWLAPAFILLLTITGLALRLRQRHPASSSAAPLTNEEQERLKQLVDRS